MTNQNEIEQKIVAQNDELGKMDEVLTDVKLHGFNVVTKRIYDKTNKELYFINENAREFLLQRVIPSIDPIGGSKNYFMYIMLKYLAKYGRHFVKHYTKMTKIDFDLYICSGQIDQGIFSSGSCDHEVSTNGGKHDHSSHK
jgi:hypothetical protein